MLSKKIATALLLGVSALNVQAQKTLSARPAEPGRRIVNNINVETDRVKSLISKMTLEEKVGQMAQITLDVIGKGNTRYESFEPFAIDSAKLNDVLLNYHIGSILNTANNRARTPEVWYGIVKQIQDVATTKSKNKVPVLYGVDEIHGATYTAGSTLFPVEIAQAASRNRELVRKAAEITAYETRASAVPWTFSPVLDLGTDPRSPRHWETMGEDPFIISELGKEIIKGYEGSNNDLSAPTHVASNMKHFLGYQATVSGKDRTPAYISTEALWEYHVPAFKAAIEAGSLTIMINSSLINGVPVHSSHEILTKLLKEKLGFKGLVVTDWQDIDNLYKRDHLANSDKEAIAMAINAGIDMSMIPYQYEVFCKGLVELVKEGKVKESRINDAVARILYVKERLGLFTTPVTNPKDYPAFGSKDFEKASYNMASEAITLLKNSDNMLPLAKKAKVFVTGPNANSMRTLNGAWSYSWQGEKTEEFAARYNTILEAVRNKAGEKNVSYEPGVSYDMGANAHYYDEKKDRFDEAVKAAGSADVILLCLGENTYVEKPGDMNDLYLSDLQTELAQKMVATGKPVVLILNEGRPRLISRFEQGVKAVVQAYLPSNFGGDALADILWGDVNPSGKLPYTYPRYPNSLVPYIHKYSEEQKKAEGAYNYEADYNPQFEFGTGLSYTTFKYSNLKVDKEKFGKADKLTITVEVANTGKRDGKESVHLFSSDLAASQVAPDMRRLRGFEKVFIKAGQTIKVSFEVKASQLAYAGPDGSPVLEPGEFTFKIGNEQAKVTLTE